ncbi:hypothetical protein [Streptomyces alboflavus]|uniref:hypothetical protein n=1 Tax=Streptomyces alboflavus TaxID=67267 RepID=UPI000AD6C36D
MVSSSHEGLHRIFQERPEILAPVFRVLGVPFPEKATLDALTPDVTETKPLERRIDTVLRIGPSDGDDFLLAVEAQGARKPDKESSWPYYVAHLRAKYRLPVLLLVVCQDQATAKWAAGPFDCGVRGWTTQRTHPLVVGPDNLPVITDQRTAAENPRWRPSPRWHTPAAATSTPYWKHSAAAFNSRTRRQPTTSTSSWTSTCGTPQPETNGGTSWAS